jgi:hypothetical protein
MQTTRGDATDREALVICDSDVGTLKLADIVPPEADDCLVFCQHSFGSLVEAD